MSLQTNSCRRCSFKRKKNASLVEIRTYVFGHETLNDFYKELVYDDEEEFERVRYQLSRIKLCPLYHSLPPVSFIVIFLFLNSVEL